jgi:putative membrane protein
LKLAAYIGGLLGLGLLIFLIVRTDLPAMLQTFAVGGWKLLCLVPYRALYLFLYTIGWFNLLRPYDSERRAGLGYLFWVTSVREAVDRVLPVASVGGGVAGVRLLRWRGIAPAPAGATVIVEILLTLIVMYLFTALGLLLLIDINAAGLQYRRFILGFVLSLPVPVLTVLLLRYGSIFERFHGMLRSLVGASAMSEGGAALDHELRACLRRVGTLLGASSLQFIALISGAFEVWFALRLFGHPIGVAGALMLESLTQAVRHLAFVVPAGLGVQEAGLIMFGHALGISSELALAVSMAKRLREVLCALPALLSWQWMEVRRLRRPLRGNMGDA